MCMKEQQLIIAAARILKIHYAFTTQIKAKLQRLGRDIRKTHSRPRLIPDALSVKQNLVGKTDNFRPIRGGGGKILQLNTRQAGWPPRAYKLTFPFVISFVGALGLKRIFPSLFVHICTGSFFSEFCSTFLVTAPNFSSRQFARTNLSRFPAEEDEVAVICYDKTCSDKVAA